MSEELVAPKPPRKPRKKKPDGITKIIRIELNGSDGDFAQEKKRLLAISTELQQVTNDFVNGWLMLHQRDGHHIAVREWIEKNREWARTYNGKKDAPECAKCPVLPIYPAMSRELYKMVCEQHPSLGTKPVGIVTQGVVKPLTSMPSSKTAYKRWMMILSGFGEFPQMRKLAPVPFYTGNSRIVRPETDEDPWKIQVRYEKIVGTRYLHPITLHMRTGGHALASIREALHKIASGEWLFNTSYLVCRHGIWYAHICYKITDAEKPVLDAKKTAFLSAGRHKLRGSGYCPVHPPGFRTLCYNCKESFSMVEGHPVLFRIGGRTLMHLRDGKQIMRVRKSLNDQRFGKNESYKYASSARKAHGRKSQEWRDKIRTMWRDHVKTFNSCLAAEVVKRCIRAKVGHLVVYQPVGNWRDSRFLTNVGKTSRKESTGWDWYQMQMLVQQACKAVGIEVTVRQIGESKKKVKKGGKGKKAA